MAEEFGYDIVFRYRGNDGLSKFQKDAEKVKRELNKIVSQATRIKRTSDAVKELTRTAFAEADREAISASKTRIQLLKEQQQQAQNVAKAQKASDDQRLRAQQRLANIAKTNATLQAAQQRRQEQAALAAQRLAAAQQRAAQQQIRFNQIQQRSATQARVASDRARASAVGHSNAIGAAIARTVRFFLLFKTVQEGIQLASRSVAESVNFAALLEDSQKQIAGLILSVGEVRNALGDTVDAAEGLPIAMGLSRRILRDLQTDAVLTAATFRELVGALQVSIAPGLANGLDVDQVRKLTVTFSQAASALGIAQRDLAEEIRSTLQGTINTRNTRIATALGITNEDIRAAKEAGTLYEFLSERMAGVSAAAKSLQSSLTVLRSNFQDVLEIAGAAGFLPLFDSLKATFSELIDLFTVGTLEDGVKIQPAVVDTIRFAAEGLAAIVDSFREFAKSDDAAELATSLAVAFGDLGKAIGEALPGILSGLTAVLKSFSTLLASIVTITSKLNPAIVELVTALLTLLPVGRFLVGLLLSVSGALSKVAVSAAGAALALGPTFAAVAAAASLAALVLGTNYVRSARKAEKASDEGAKALARWQSRQKDFQDSLVTTSDRVGLSAERLESFTEQVQKAADEAERFGKTQIEIAELDRRNAVEEKLLEIQEKQRIAQSRYNNAVQESQDKVDKLPESLQRVARLNAELLRVQGSDDAISSSLRLTEELADIDDGFEAKLSALREQAKAVQDERVRLEKEFQEAVRQELLREIDEDISLLSRGRTDRRTARGVFQSVPEGLSEYDKAMDELLRKRQAVVDADSTSFDDFSGAAKESLTLLGRIGRATDDAIEALLQIGKEEQNQKALQEDLVELKRQEAQLDLEILALSKSVASIQSKKVAESTEALQRELRLEQQITAADGDREKLDAIQLRQRFLSREAEIQEQILAAERELAVVERSDKDGTSEAAQILQATLDRLREQKVLLVSITEQKQLQAAFDRQQQQDRPADAVDLVRLQQEFDLRRQLASLDRRTIELQAEADIAANRADSAQSQYEAAKKQLQVDLTISQLNQNFLESQRRAVILQAQQSQDSEERARLAGDILDLETAITEEKASQQVLAAQLAAEEKRRRQETELGAGFDAGLARAIESREVGRVFGSLAEDLASSLEGGIVGALDAALTGGDVGASIDSMAEYMRQAVIKALVSAFVVNPLLQDLLPAAAAGGVNASGVGGSSPANIFPLAEGGSVPGPNMDKALPGHPSSDRTLIAATPGEYVLPTSLTSALGTGFLDKLRSLSFSASEARAAMMARLGSFRGPIKPYLGGGPVGSTSPQVVRTDTTQRGNRGVTPVVFVDRKVAQTIMNNPTFTENLRAKSKYAGQGPREYL